MTSIKKALLYGFLIWLFIFLIGFMAFIVHESNRPLFESIMAVAVTTVSMIFTIAYFRKVDKNLIREGFYLGMIFFLVNVIIDLPLFLLESPMQTTPGNYFSDIGCTYLLFFAVTIGVGYVLENRLSMIGPDGNSQ